MRNALSQLQELPSEVAQPRRKWRPIAKGFALGFAFTLIAAVAVMVTSDMGHTPKNHHGIGEIAFYPIQGLVGAITFDLARKADGYLEATDNPRLARDVEGLVSIASFATGIFKYPVTGLILGYAASRSRRYLVTAGCVLLGFHLIPMFLLVSYLSH